MSSSGHVVVLVYSTSHAVRGERLLMQEGIDVKLIPVPRQFSSDCGVCLRVREEDRGYALQVLTEGGVGVEEVHEF